MYAERVQVREVSTSQLTVIHPYHRERVSLKLVGGRDCTVRGTLSYNVSTKKVRKNNTNVNSWLIMT